MLCLFVAWRGCVVPLLLPVLCVCGVCVGGSGGAVVWVCLPRVLVCVPVCVWCVGGLCLLVLVSLGSGLLLMFVWVWLVCVVAGPPPVHAEGPECDSPQFLSQPRCRWWWVFPRHSWLSAPDAGPRHSWLGSAGGGGV